MDEKLKAWLRTSPRAASALDLMCMAWEESARLEREACAKACDDAIPPGCSTSMVDVSRIQGIKHCAAAIRARSVLTPREVQG